MITSELLAKLFPGTSAQKRDRFVEPLNKFLPVYGIDTCLRVCAFLATGGIETDFLRVTTEYASGADYEGRKDLGNSEPGDGRRFRGRGFFQTTGRYNYARLNETASRKLGMDFLKNPERLADIDVAVESACIFWQDNNLSKYADTSDFRNLSSIVNCGKPNRTPNAWAKRNELYSLCKRNVPKDFSFLQSRPVADTLRADTDVVPSNREPAAASAFEPETSSVKSFADKYLVHCPTDTVKNIFFVIAARISAWATALWQLGFHGKALCFLIAFGAIVPLVWAGVKYRSRLVGWIKDIVDSYFSAQ